MQNVRIFVATALAVGLTGCLSPTAGVPEKELQPLPAFWRTSLADAVKAGLKDPYSVRSAAVTQPRKNVSGGRAAWRTCVVYNARNAFGAYSGLDSAAYYLIDGRWVQNAMEMGTREWAKRNGANVGLCKDSTGPFPELGPSS